MVTVTLWRMASLCLAFASALVMCVYLCIVYVCLPSLPLVKWDIKIPR